MSDTECDPYDMAVEELRKRPRCPTCRGRDTVWVPDSEESPRERVFCMTCAGYCDGPRTCNAQLFEQHDGPFPSVSFVIGVSPWWPRRIHAGEACAA